MNEETFQEAARKDPRTSEELIQLALSRDMDHDEDYWEPVENLQRRIPEILEPLREMAGSTIEKVRVTAAVILGQGRVREKVATADCTDILLARLNLENAPLTLVALAYALGHLGDERSIEPLVRLHDHTDADVRYAVTWALCGVEHASAIAALIDGSRDSDRDVRNWATFGLGSQIDTDTPAIRQALLERLGEPDDEIRGEALVGLARRGDLRVAEALLKELNSFPAEELLEWVLITDAAEAIVEQARATGQSGWIPVLQRLQALGIGDQAALQTAIERCTHSIA